MIWYDAVITIFEEKTMSLKLTDLITEIATLSDDIHKYFNIETYEIVTISAEALYIAEESNPGADFTEYPDWQQESILQALDVIRKSGSKYISLPDKWDIHEHQIMENFCLSFQNKTISAVLYNSIKGKGAFRHFKENINRYGIRDEWYRFYDEVLKNIAILWCEKHRILYDE
jgi:hypothetical protein